MLPCQKSCPNHTPGCHKNCSRWKDFQKQQAAQRQLKKTYLNYYNELCGTMARQFNILSPIRW